MSNPSDQNNFGSAKRGFAALDPARRSAIARQGGRAAHEKGTAHEFTPAEARAAGLKSREARRQQASARAGESAAAKDGAAATAVAGKTESEGS